MSDLTHLDESGAARMVDVGGKPATARTAVAAGAIRMSRPALAAVREGNGPKGDFLAAARIAGIMGAKKTAELIPLCHPLGLDLVTVEFAFLEDGIEVPESDGGGGAAFFHAVLAVESLSRVDPSIGVLVDVHVFEGDAALTEQATRHDAVGADARAEHQHWFHFEVTGRLLDIQPLRPPRSE